MAPVRKNTIKQHFTHPQHPLTKVEAKTEYHCDGCKSEAIGHGTSYRCNEGCNFNLHDICATCPTTLSTFMHPQHPLTLFVRKPPGTRQMNRRCDLCRDPVEGLFYRCKVCDFDVHPLCTQLPEKLHHGLHTCHHLQLRTSTSGSCAVCRCWCTSWRYGCVTCDFNIHINCILVAPPPTIAHTNSVPPYGPPLISSSSSSTTGVKVWGFGKNIFWILLKPTPAVLSQGIGGFFGVNIPTPFT